MKCKTILLGSFLCIAMSVGQSAFAEKMHGIFMVAKGSVQIKSGETLSAVKVGSKVFEGDSVITGVDSRAKIVMQDRNVLNVSPDTEFQIPTYKNDAATGTKDVQINLLKGKIRANVEQNYDGSKNKFLIKTPTAVAGVRGTQFTTGYNPLTRMTSVVTFKGAVAFATINNQGRVVGKPVIIKKGQTSSAIPGGNPEPPKVMQKEEMNQVESETSVSTTVPDSTTTTTNGDAATSTQGEGPSSGRDPAAVNPSLDPVAAPMIDKKDLDVKMAADIKDVRTAPAVIPANTRAPTSAPNSAVTDIIREKTGKTKVIVKPQR